MHRFIVLLFLSSLSMPVFAEKVIIPPPNYYTSYYAPQAYYGGDYIPQRRYTHKNRSVFSDINELEKYAMNKVFAKDSDRMRLERLETLAFGAVQEGDIYKRYDNVKNSILSRPKPNNRTSLARSLSNYFNGQLTGFTPSLTNSYDNYYPSDFEKKSYTQYSSPWGSGYKINYYGTNSGSGIHFLD